MNARIKSIKLSKLSRKTLDSHTVVNVAADRHEEILRAFKWIIHVELGFDFNTSIIVAKNDAKALYDELKEFFTRTCADPSDYELKFILGGAHILLRDDAVAALFKLQWIVDETETDDSV